MTITCARERLARLVLVLVCRAVVREHKLTDTVQVTEEIEMNSSACGCAPRGSYLTLPYLTWGSQEAESGPG